MSYVSIGAWRMFVISLLASTLSFAAHAGVVILGTRVVYPSDARDVNVRLSNNGEVPSLIQAWIDDGKPSASPESLKVPFVVTPPLARVDPGKNQNLRIVFTGSGLPADKETLYWLNVLEIPPKAPDGTNSLQFAVRTRIKIFYRPSQLKNGAAAAVGTVQWSISRTGIGKNYTVEARNPSPFYVSMSNVRLVAGESAVGKSMNVTLPPGETERFEIPESDAAGTSTPTAIRYQMIDDYGAFIDGEKRL